MAIKFSQFVVKTSSSDLSHIVGYNGVDNIQITPTNFLNSALTGTPGQVLFFDTTGVTGSNSLFFDTSNNRLGIGTTSPGEPLEVHGNIKARFAANGAIGQIKLGNLSNIYADNGDLQIRNNVTGLVKVTSGGNVGIGTTNPSQKLEVDGNIKVRDSQKYIAGNSQDLQIYHDGTTSNISNDTGNLSIINHADDGDIKFFSDDGSGGVAEYFRLDGGNVNMITSVNNVFVDNKKAAFGDSADLEIYHDGSHSYVKQGGTGDLYIQQFRDDGDIVFQCDDGSGGITEYFRLDGSNVRTTVSKPFRFNDGIAAEFGTGLDMQIYHSGGEGTMQNYVGNLRFIQSLNDGDIQFFSDDGSGGTTEYFRVDGGENRIVYSQDGRHLDNVKSMYGSGADLQISHDGTNSSINNITGNLNIQNRADDADISFKCDDGSGGITEYFRLDGGLASGGELKTLFPDNSRIVFGDGADFNFYHDGTDSRIQNTTGHIRIINFADNSDIIFSSDDGSGGTTEYFRLDGGLGYTVVSKLINFSDDVAASFGGSGDLNIRHDGTDNLITGSNGDIVITNNADNKDIIFKSDDGSGSVTSYFSIDGSAELNRFQKNVMWNDSVVAYFGGGFDLQIYHDGSNSFIDDSGTGDLRIRSNFVTIEKYNNGEIMASFNDDNAVSLYFNNSKKFETTSTGIKISGVSEYADNTAAIAGGLTTGDVYRTGDLLKIVH